MSAFPQTRWSMISAAGDTGEERSVDALEELCRVYRPAVQAFAQQALNGNLHDAEDLTQEFFADFLARGRIEAVETRTGKFRTYLLTHFKYVLLDYLKRRRAEKRGGGIDHKSAEELTDAETPITTPDSSVFDVQWAMSVVREAVRLLEAEESSKKGGVPFKDLRGFLPGFGSVARPEYSDLSAKYGVSEGALRVRINRLRERFKELLNSVLSDTVSTAADLESERQSLLGGLLRSLQ